MVDALEYCYSNRGLFEKGLFHSKGLFKPRCFEGGLIRERRGLICEGT